MLKQLAGLQILVSEQSEPHECRVCLLFRDCSTFDMDLCGPVCIDCHSSLVRAEIELRAAHTEFPNEKGGDAP
jgi:hypothetical protein